MLHHTKSQQHPNTVLFFIPIPQITTITFKSNPKSVLLAYRVGKSILTHRNQLKFNPLIPDFVMVHSTTAQLSKLLASYLSTSNDALAVSFRKHYSSTLTATSSHKTTTKRTTHRLTSATFTYRWIDTAPQRITKLYQLLLRAQWIALDTNPDDFFSLFTGKDSNSRIKWTGSNLQLAYLIRVMTERNYISAPKRIGKWTCIYNHIYG